MGGAEEVGRERRGKVGTWAVCRKWSCAIDRAGGVGLEETANAENDEAPGTPGTHSVNPCSSECQKLDPRMRHPES